MKLKRLKRDLALYNLPTQVLEWIFQLSGRSGLVKLGLLNHQYREELLSFIYKDIKLIWHDLNLEPFDAFVSKYQNFIDNVRIVDCYGYGEWQLNSECLFKLNLTKLQINSYNSSNWLKYKESHSLKTLVLYYEPQHNETESFYTNPNPKNIHRLKSSNIPKIFNLTHLSRFSQLNRLDLTNYHFNWDDNVDCPSIKFLSLTDCTWEYPFTLNKFNETNSLLTLKLIYTDDNSFIISERFGKLLAMPLQADAGLEQLTINFIGCQIKRTLSINQFKVFLKLRKLRKLDLSTWHVNSRGLVSYINSLDKLPVDQLVLDLQGYEITRRV